MGLAALCRRHSATLRSFPAQCTGSHLGEPLGPLSIFVGELFNKPAPWANPRNTAPASLPMATFLASCLATSLRFEKRLSLLTAFPLSRTPLVDMGGSNHKTRFSQIMSPTEGLRHTVGKRNRGKKMNRACNLVSLVGGMRLISHKGMKNTSTANVAQVQGEREAEN